MAQPSGQVALAAGNASEYFWYAQSTGIWDAKNSAMLTKTGSAGMSTEGGANVAVGDAATSYALGSAIDLAGPWSVIIRCRAGATSGSNGMVLGNAGYDNYLWLRQAAGLVVMNIDAAAGSASPTADVTAMTTWGLVFNSGVLIVYKDGTSIGTSTYTGTGHLKITKLLSGYMSGQYAFDGTFECANVIPSALTAGDITTRTANLYAVLDAGTGTDGTATGAPDTLDLIAPSATAAGTGNPDGTGAGAPASLTLTVPSATATGTSSGTNGTGSGAPTAMSMAAPSASATGTTSGSGTLVTPVLKNNTGTVLASETGITVNVYNATTGALVLHKTGQTSNGSGIVTVIDAALTPATTYAYEVVLSGGARRLPTGIVS